ncbi:conjugal transfer protein [Streptomyces daliensis]|uniref:Conjugal transfer protein n=1 Tax=Streptomyces daliensis TaxID=299421 RepID=A0A8T4J0C8_9ACTN|nr:conjugal transfer protein [Streptomyces daliensis]
MSARRPLTKTQKAVLALAFGPMLATGIGGGIGTYSNISAAYGAGTAAGAVAAGEGATAVLALVLLGLTMLGQSSPLVIRAGLWALPAAASAMAVTAADEAGQAVIYAVTPMGMTVAAEGMAFLARRIVVHLDGRDAEAEARAAAIVRALAYHRARAANHPAKGARKRSDRRSWRLARKVGSGDDSLAGRLLEVQRDRVTAGANDALSAMFTPTANQVESAVSLPNRSTAEQGESTPAPVDLHRVGVPDPAPVGHLKSALALKPGPATTALPTGRGSVAAESTRPRRATGRVPAAARPARPKRTSAQLLTEARSATADWTDAALTAEGIRKAVHTSPARARMLRETLRTEREGQAAEQRHQLEEPEVEAA